MATMTRTSSAFRSARKNSESSFLSRGNQNAGSIDKPAYSARELGDILKVSGRTIRRMTETGMMPSVMLGGVERFTAKAVAAMLDRLHVAPTSTSSIGNDWMTPKDVARLFGKNEETILRWCRKGQVPHYRLGQGKSLRFRRSEIEGG